LKEGTTGDLQSELIRLGVRRLVEEALEAEAREALGRGYYQPDRERRALPQRLSPRTNAHCRGRD
jgi:transposase-like protein